MAFKYQPVSDEQLEKEANDRKEANLLPDGEYDFEISDGRNHISAAGKESIKLTIMVFKDDDKFVTVYDYLTPAYMSKFKHAAQACGLQVEYDAGTLDGEMFSGKAGRVLITKQGAQNGYGPKNTVQDYVVGSAKTVKVKPTIDDLNDDIPWS